MNDLDKIIECTVDAEEKIVRLYNLFRSYEPGNDNMLEHTKAVTDAWRAMEDIQRARYHLENIRERNV